MLQLRSLIKPSGELEFSLARVPIPEPKEDEILVRVDATPINPSDLMTMFGPADMSNFHTSGSGDDVKVTAKIPPALIPSVSLRFNENRPCGNEGAGHVVKAGSKPEAQALVGKNVAMLVGGLYAEFRSIKYSDAMPLPTDVTAVEAAAPFVNPLTVLCFLETMKREGHSGIVHTAAASNLGQMLVKVCIKDNIPLVNIVRSEAQVKILKALGAKYVVDTSTKSFFDDLVQALFETSATLAFDAIWGGKLVSQILLAMDAAILKKNPVYNQYGTQPQKQVYVYGALDPAPIELPHYFGFNWSTIFIDFYNYNRVREPQNVDATHVARIIVSLSGRQVTNIAVGVGGYLMANVMGKLGADGQKLRIRVIEEIKTTFASQYEGTLSLHEVVQPQHISAYTKKTTGKKYLIVPSKK